MAFHNYDPASSLADPPRYGPGDAAIEKQVYASVLMDNDVALAHLRKWREDGEASHLAAILKANQRMLYQYAKAKYATMKANPRVMVADLFQEACIGFWKGLEKFDESKANRGVRAAKVSSVAMNHAKKLVLKLIADMTGPVYVPDTPVKMAHKFERLRKEVAHEMGVEEDELHIEDVFLDKTPTERAGARVFLQTHRSIDNEPFGDGESCNEEPISDRRHGAYNMEALPDAKTLLIHIEALPAPTARLIKGHFQISNEDVADVEVECGIHPMMVESMIVEGIAILKLKMGAPPAP